MGRASRGKKDRRDQARERPHLERKLNEQLELLQKLGEMYDIVSPIAALPLATCVRVLLHQTTTSHAVLQQLGVLSSLRFRDTSWHGIPGNLLAHNGLVVMEMTSGVGGRYVPRLAVTAEQGNPDLSFGRWWNDMVLKDAPGTTWTRKSLILEVANKEGGAHLDPSQPASIRALEHENSMGWVFNDAEGERPFANNPLAPSVRQIAREVELTLEHRIP